MNAKKGTIRDKNDFLTNVYEMSLLVDHDVAVVPVLDLEEEADHAVRGHRGDERSPGALETLRKTSLCSSQN